MGGMWPTSTASSIFAGRRDRFLEQFQGTAAIGSGLPRLRNFEGSAFPFRASSHFVYFVGRHLPESLIAFDAGKAVLYTPPEDPQAALWHAPAPSLSELSRELEMEVLPLSDFEPGADVATFAPADVESASWLEEILQRPVTPAGFESLKAAGPVSEAFPVGDSSSALDQDFPLIDAMIALRLVHDSGAIEQLRQAAEVTKRAHLAGFAATRGAAREADIRAAMEAEICRSGMTTAYNSIVTVSGNVLHHMTSHAPLVAGQLILADVGAETPEGWAGDATRTWPVSGRFEGLQADLYDIVLSVQQRAIARIAPGVSYLKVHRQAGEELLDGLIDLGLLRGDREDLAQKGAASLFFPHGLGHLLGLDVHDMEDLGDRAGYAPGRSRSQDPIGRFLRLDRDLEAGMAVTVEPGFYMIPALLEDKRLRAALDPHINQQLLSEVAKVVSGIRIEDDILVTEEGREVLTHGIPKVRADVEAALRD